MANGTKQSTTESPATEMLSPEQVVQQLRALREQIPLPDPLPALSSARRSVEWSSHRSVQPSRPGLALTPCVPSA